MVVEKNSASWQTAVSNISRWLHDQFLENVPLEDRIGRFLASFTQNLDQFIAQYPEKTDLTRPELALLMAVVFLYPAEETADWQQLVKQLLAHAANGKAPSNEALLDLAIAYGCGWQRALAIRDHETEERWHRAILALRIMVEGSLHQTFKLIIPLLPYQISLFSGSIKEWGRFYSNVITLELLNNRCRCGKHKQDCKKKGDSYVCGRACCRDEHQLAAWEPKVCSLQAFVAHSIRGNASSQLKTGALATSMLYPLLNEDSGITVDSVEFKVCGRCSDTAVLQSIAQHQEPKSQGSVMYEGNSCPECDAPANRQTTYHKARKNWILIPYELGGAYEMLDRWRCPRCRNLFPITWTACPICASSTPQRKTNIWVYSPWLQYSDEEEDSR